MSVTIEEVVRVRDEADCLWTADEVMGAIDRLAMRMAPDLMHRHPVFLVVMTGGVMFASELLKRLSFPLTLDYVHATRYGAALSGSELLWKVAPSAALQGRTVVILDDILDEGNTLVGLIDACREQGACDVLTAVLVEKRHDRKCQPDLHANYTALEVPDRYVFGFGMDYKGYLRNLPGIHAVKGA